MSGRTSGVAFLLAIALSAPAVPQVASAPLGSVDAWGVGWLGASEGALPAGLWSNTDGDTLTPVYAAIQPKDLAPSARHTLRRIVLSKTRAPAGGAALVSERLRLMEQLGESEHAVDLRMRYPETEWGKPGERMAAEFELVQGKSDAACARATGKRGDDRDWMAVRAFCSAVSGNFDAAALVGEQLANLDEPGGLWLLAAVETMRAPTKTKLEGRYSTPFETAVSVAAKLSVPANALAAAPGDVAAAIVLNPAATLDQRRGALRPALDGGQIKPSDVLAVLTAKNETQAPKPTGGRAQAPKPDFLALALAAFANAEAQPDAKATAYVAALKSAENLSDFRLAAAALADAIKALPKNEATQPNAETFARAALLMGETKQASDWRKLMDQGDKDKADPWAAARIDLMLSYAGVGADKAGPILDRLVAAAPPVSAMAPATTAKAATAADRQLDLRRIENTRALFLHAGTGRDLSPAQRTLLATQKSAGRGVPDAAITRIVSAADQDADGEAALAIVAQLGPDISALSFAGLSDLLVQLRRVGFEKDANTIALESLQVWKAL